MFWTACPEAPFIKLSIIENTTKLISPLSLTLLCNEILQLFTNNYKWLNSNNYNIILLEADNIGENNEKINLLCSKFINYKNKINYSNNFVFIIKLREYYEPIIKVSLDNSNIIEINNFDYYKNNELQYIIDYQKNLCNNTKLNKIIDPLVLYETLLNLHDNKYKIRFFVILEFYEDIFIINDHEFKASKNNFVKIRNAILFSLSSISS